MGRLRGGCSLARSAFLSARVCFRSDDELGVSCHDGIDLRGVLAAGLGEVVLQALQRGLTSDGTAEAYRSENRAELRYVGSKLLDQLPVPDSL